MKDEVTASAAAHRDLGPAYDAALAEGLVERIGEEIDKRVDARLAGQGPSRRPPRLHREPAPGRIGFGAVVLALGSMGMAVGATLAVIHPGDNPGPVTGSEALLITLIWIVVGVINVAYARHRWLFVCGPVICLRSGYLSAVRARCSVRITRRTRGTTTSFLIAGAA